MHTSVGVSSIRESSRSLPAVSGKSCHWEPCAEHRGRGRCIVVAVVSARIARRAWLLTAQRRLVKCQCAQRRSLDVEPKDKAKANEKAKA